MDVALTYIFDAGLVFFAAWGLILAAVSVIAFGGDFLPSAQRATGEEENL